MVDESAYNNNKPLSILEAKERVLITVLRKFEK